MAITPFTSTDQFDMAGFNGMIDEANEAFPLAGITDPTTSTVGVLGQIYMDTSTDPATSYQCVKVDSGVYTWAKSKADNAVTGTYPVAAGQSITAGDVVDVVGGAVTKAGTPSQAIALTTAAAGVDCEIIYSGVAALSGVTVGQKITSDGVYGVGVLAGVLQVWSKDRPGQVVTGSYTGTGTYGESGPVVIDVGFKPAMVIVRLSGAVQQAYGVIMLRGGTVNLEAAPGSSGWPNIIYSFNNNGVSFFGDGSAINSLNVLGSTYNYIVFA